MGSHTHHQSLTPLPHILTLPDELLLQIFSAVKSWKPINNALHVDFASSSRDIASARLVCQRFAATSSHLLVHYVCLDGINTRSLRKLEAISSHPLIGRGVRMVRLEALYYTSALADSAENFTWYAINKAYQRALKYRQDFDAQVAQAGDVEETNECERLLCRKAEVGPTLESVKVVLKAWSCIDARDTEQPLKPLDAGSEISGDDDIQPDNEKTQLVVQYVRALGRTHEEYQLQFREQENLRKNNAFIKRFAAAMARMPRARSLEIQDFQHNQEVCSVDGDELADLLDVESLARPICWADGLARQLGSPPVEILFALPTEIQKAGGRLDRVSIQTSVPAEQYYPLLGEVESDEYVKLGAAVNLMRVKSFSFLHGGGPEPSARATPTPEDVGHFLSYLIAMSNSGELERLRVMADSGWADGSLDPSHTVSLGSILIPDMASRVTGGGVLRLKLTDVYLENFPLHLSDLEGFSSYMEQTGRHDLEFLTLSRTNLVTGTWAQAVGILRRMNISDKELIEPIGAELTDSDMLLSGWYEKMFRTQYGQRSVVERFINEELEHNPLRQDWLADLVHSVDKEEVGGVVMEETIDRSESIDITELDENIDDRGDSAGMGTEGAP